jgi:TRAP-type transport system periplasmic protein
MNTKEKGIKLRLGGYQGMASVHTRGLQALASTFEQRMGEGTTSLIPSVTDHGHKASDLLTLTENGELDICYFASSYLAARVPALGVLDMPFQVEDRAHAFLKLDGDGGDRLVEAVADATGFRVLAFWDNGFRHISNAVRPIRHPDDCRGLTLRTLDNALHQEIFASFGFKPRFIDVKDLPRAVQTREVDAQENPLTNLVNFNLHKTHRHVSLTAHFFGVALLLVSKAAFDGWPLEFRQALAEAIASATVTQREAAAAEDVTCMDVLKKDGGEVVAPEDIDRDAFRAAVSGIIQRETDRIGPEGRALLGE